MQPSENTAAFAAHYNQHYFSIVVNGNSINIIDSLPNQQNIASYIQSIMPNYDVEYTPLDIQDRVGVNTCGYITLAALQYLHNNQFDVGRLVQNRDELVMQSREILAESNTHTQMPYQEEHNFYVEEEQTSSLLGFLAVLGISSSIHYD
jgi:hypothetical protein